MANHAELKDQSSLNIVNNQEPNQISSSNPFARHSSTEVIKDQPEDDFEFNQPPDSGQAGPRSSIIRNFEQRQEIRSAVNEELGRDQQKEDAEMDMFCQMNDELPQREPFHENASMIDLTNNHQSTDLPN